jgi:hypothetical protein
VERVVAGRLSQMSVTIFLLESSVCTYVFLDGGDGLAEIGVLA